MSGEVDAAVLANPPRDKRVLRLDLGSQDMMALIPRDYPIAARKSVSLKSLEKVPVIYREKGSNTQRLLEKALASDNVSLQPSLTLGSREAVREAVLCGLGVGFIFSREVDRDPRAVAVPIRGLTGSSDDKLVCLRRRTRRQVIKALLRCANDTPRAAILIRRLRRSRIEVSEPMQQFALANARFRHIWSLAYRP